MNDAHYLWALAIPMREGLRELHEVEEHAQLSAELTFCSRRIANVAKADKMNVAALGNMIPQLHIHIIARHKTDAAWPQPIWGVVPMQAYEKSAADTLIHNLKINLTQRD